MSGVQDKIKSFQKIMPMMYAYSTPGIPYHDGWLKIGYTEKQTVSDRIRQQTHTAGIKAKLEWSDIAMYKDGSGEYLTDHDFHAYLQREKNVEREPKTEWFKIDKMSMIMDYNDFAMRNVSSSSEQYEYTLRNEQQIAVQMTKKYFEEGGKEFLWNAKPRFGKTLTSYDLVRQMNLENVLIVTNRPSIANSWADDFNKFISWQTNLEFVSDTESLKGKSGVRTRDEFTSILVKNMIGLDSGMVAFESLQGLKGSVYFGGQYDKLEWIKRTDWDLLIVDESQEGVDTMKTERAFDNINRKYTLYLSGTPFKQLASDQFSAEQIYNWSYADEQEAKDDWTGEDYNPYENLPKLSMFTYQLSNMIYETMQAASLEDDDSIDMAFDLNEFFITNDSGKFIHEVEIRKFLRALTTQEKYPFSTAELREELSHTLWLLNRVASAKALARLLKDDEFKDIFGDYAIVVAAGDGRDDDIQENIDSFNKVKKAIAENEKTITISVGQLTVGVTIPEWSGVLMLCNMKSPSSYMQAAFRAQNPCTMTRDGVRMRKETAYVFDFDPARTLIIFDEFANNLSPETVNGSGTSEDRKKNIKRLLNFFPVLGEDSEGKMVELNASEVLSIPRKIKSQEVVRHGFMSNFLFTNISNVFAAPWAVREIIAKIEPAKEEKTKKKADVFENIEDISVNADGEVEISNERIIGTAKDIFAPKVYEEAVDELQQQAGDIISDPQKIVVDRKIDDFKKIVKEKIDEQFIQPAVEKYDVKKGFVKTVTNDINNDLDRTFEKIKGDFHQAEAIAKVELDRKRSDAEGDEKAIKKAEDYFSRQMGDAFNSLTEAINNTINTVMEEKPKSIIEQMERHEEEKKKKDVEDTVRDHLRGFSRTIPSFIMAYGDEQLKLSNFDDYTEDDVFLEVTGITEDEFRFLRDGGEYVDENGETKQFSGHLFDETVFDDSIQEFLRKKAELADYFNESHIEDIFDYIPPQKTNQIFTPKWVVKKMVDQLEVENPGCFDDPNNTFADLYMKSGLYITEIIKRLYRSNKMKEYYPDNTERLKHIIENQVYGMAPTRIIFLIATNYILGFDESLKKMMKHFVQADAAEAAKNGTLQELVDKYFAE